MDGPCYWDIKRMAMSQGIAVLEINETPVAMLDLETTGFMGKEALLDEECEKFLSTYKSPSDTALPAGEDFRKLTPQLRKTITEYVKDYVPLNKYL